MSNINENEPMNDQILNRPIKLNVRFKQMSNKLQVEIYAKSADFSP